MIRSAVSILALTVAFPALADDPRALVIGIPDGATPMAFADSYNVAQAFRAAGLSDVTLLRDVNIAEIETQWAEIDPDLVYLTGPIPDQLRRRLGENRRPDILLLDDCVQPESVSGAGVALASAAGLCETSGGLAGQISRASPTRLATEFNDVLRTAWTAAPPGNFEVAVPSTRSSTLGAVPVVADSVVSISPVSAASSGGSLTAAVAGAGSDVAIFVAPDASQLAAVPLGAGLPEPSIIVGVIAPTNASFSTVEDETTDVSGSEISFDNLEARRALRANSPELFESLVSGGAFDPPDVQLATALQTELQRMGCYRSRIDGDWGRGSRAAAGRYFDQIPGVEAESLDPTVDLFRQVIRKDDVICPAPAPVAAAAPRATSSGGGSTRTARPAASAPARAAPARTAPAPAAPRRTISRGGLGSGVFR